jgi:hypothetical protein
MESGLLHLKECKGEERNSYNSGLQFSNYRRRQKELNIRQNYCSDEAGYISMNPVWGVNSTPFFYISFAAYE